MRTGLAGNAEVGDDLGDDVVHAASVEVSDARTVVGLTAEQVVVPLHVWVVLHVQFDGFADGSVNGDGTVLAFFAGLLFDELEGLPPIPAFVEKVAELQSDEVGDAEGNVDAYDEKHVVAPTVVINKVCGNAEDIGSGLDWLTRMLIKDLPGHPS